KGLPDTPEVTAGLLSNVGQTGGRFRLRIYLFSSFACVCKFSRPTIILKNGSKHYFDTEFSWQDVSQHNILQA
ncbi:MAG: hypothetical protein AB8B94_17040, partial [Hyphomicrobiales bacterium]